MKEHLPLVEFTNDRVIQRTIGMTQFEVVYGFNLITPLDFNSLSQDVVLILEDPIYEEAS